MLTFTYATLDDPSAANGTPDYGINDNGQIVGYFNDASGFFGFLDSGSFTKRPEVAAIVLDSSPRASAQIAEALRGTTELEAIHIVAHGRPGELSFVAGSVLLESLDDDAENLSSIAEALDPGGDVLLWACDTGKGQRPPASSVEPRVEDSGSLMSAEMEPPRDHSLSLPRMRSPICP